MHTGEAVLSNVAEPNKPDNKDMYSGSGLGYQTDEVNEATFHNWYGSTYSIMGQVKVHVFETFFLKSAIEQFGLYFLWFLFHQVMIG